MSVRSAPAKARCRGGEGPPHARGGKADTDLIQLAVDSAISPGWILPRQLQNDGNTAGRNSRSP